MCVCVCACTHMHSRVGSVFAHKKGCGVCATQSLSIEARCEAVLQTGIAQRQRGDRSPFFLPCNLSFSPYEFISWLTLSADFTVLLKTSALIFDLYLVTCQTTHDCTVLVLC